MYCVGLGNFNKFLAILSVYKDWYLNPEMKAKLIHNRR